ncbi:MAG: hypothetical protein FVQ80_18140 [Planctomycetes bacterium]|nr:hypothetical protein [Planctomycetota bacterium]
MTKIMLFATVIFLVTVISAPIFAGSKKGDSPKQEKSFAVENSNHVQVLGGRSRRAWRGLENASRHSDAIVPQNTKEDPDKDDLDDTDDKDDADDPKSNTEEDHDSPGDSDDAEDEEDDEEEDDDDSGDSAGTSGKTGTK